MLIIDFVYDSSQFNSLHKVVATSVSSDSEVQYFFNLYFCVCQCLLSFHCLDSAMTVNVCIRLQSLLVGMLRN